MQRRITSQNVENGCTMKRIVNELPVYGCFMIVSLVLVDQCKSCQLPSSTVRHVDRCPESLLEWNKASKRKDCLQFTRNCTNSIKYEYHCVINAFINATLEVCAPSTKIIGHRCAEFNALGEKMQENQESKCAACEYTYSSTDSYKYQECYKKVKRQYSVGYQVSSATTRRINEIQNNTSEIMKEDTKANQLYIIIGILSLLLVILLVAFIIWRWNYKNKKKNINNDNRALDRTDEDAGSSTKEESSDELQDEKIDLLEKPSPEKPSAVDLRSSIRTYLSDESQLSNDTISDGETPSVIVAISLGEYFTKYAYSKKEDPLKISTSHCPGMDFEVRSAILLDPELNVLAYGQDAYIKFHTTKETDKPQCIFFENVLNWENLPSISEQDKKCYMIKASNNSYKAKDVLQRFIGCIVLTLTKEEKLNLNEVNFVIAIPNNWIGNEDRRNLIKEAVTSCMFQTPIKNTQIHILKTADTIKPFLISRPSCEVHNLAPENMNFQPKTSFIVVHIDKAGFEFTLLKGCKDKESPKLTHKCVKWEDACVERGWYNFLLELLGDSVRQLEDHNWEDYRVFCEKIDVVQELEENLKPLHLPLPRSLQKLIRKKSKIKVDKLIAGTKFKEQVKFENQELIIDRKLFQSFLEPAKRKLSSELNKWRNEKQMFHADPTFVCMTGLYSKIHAFREEIKTQFIKMVVMIPHDVDQVIVKGAVINGYEKWLPRYFDEQMRILQSSFREYDGID